MAQESSDALSARSVLPLAARVIMVHVDELAFLKRLVAHAAGVLLCSQQAVELLLGQPVARDPVLLEATPDAATQLQVAARTLAEGGPVQAYARSGDHGAGRLAGLGPAFGTKFLYFCSGPGNRPALILDRLVAQWLRGNIHITINEVRWSVATYTRYLETMYGWAGELALAADEPEACIFSEQAGFVGSQWASGNASSS
jgi:hypothetical protein